MTCYPMLPFLSLVGTFCVDDARGGFAFVVTWRPKKIWTWSKSAQMLPFVTILLMSLAVTPDNSKNPCKRYILERAINSLRTCRKVAFPGAENIQAPPATNVPRFIWHIPKFESILFFYWRELLTVIYDILSSLKIDQSSQSQQSRRFRTTQEGIWRPGWTPSR